MTDRNTFMISILWIAWLDWHSSCFIQEATTQIKTMKKTILAVLAIGALSCGLFSQQAQATQISGTIRFVGGVHLDNNHLGLATTVVTWFDLGLNPGHSTVLTGDGDLNIAPGTQADMHNGWNFAGGGPQPGLWSVGGFTFDLASATITSQSNFFLNVLAEGTISGNGFDPTPGVFSFTIDNANGRPRVIFGFAAEGASLPDGGTTVMLLGAAIGALGMARRFLKK